MSEDIGVEILDTDLGRCVSLGAYRTVTALMKAALAERDAEIARWAKSLGDCHKALAEARRQERELLIARLKGALNGACECGGQGPDDCCLACEVWHRFRALGDEP